MKRRLFIISVVYFLIISTFSLSYAKSHYNISWKKESSIYLSGTSIMLLAIYFKHKITPMTENEINKLSKSDINLLDRSATSNYSTSADEISDYLLISSYIFPSMLFLSREIRKDIPVVCLLYSETLFLTNSLMLLSKGSIKRTRPYVYNDNVSLNNKTNKHARTSFFSGHTSNAFASAVFLSTIFTNYHPESKWKNFIWSTSLLGASTVGYLCFKAGEHYPTDILTGALIGSLAGYLIPYIHKNDRSSRLNISPQIMTGYFKIKLSYRF